jgi:hypothetical protein
MARKADLPATVPEASESIFTISICAWLPVYTIMVMMIFFARKTKLSALETPKGRSKCRNALLRE